MRTVLLILGVINGAYMLLDGIHVWIQGKYIGPEKPGPWSILFQKLGWNVFQLGPLFIVFGLAWLIWVVSLWTVQPWALMYGLIVSFATLWYLPLGTLISIVTWIIILFF